MNAFLSAFFELVTAFLISTSVIMCIYLISTIAAQNAIKVHDDIRHNHPEVASHVEKV